MFLGQGLESRASGLTRVLRPSAGGFHVRCRESGQLQSIFRSANLCASLIQCLDPVFWVVAAATEFTLLNGRRNNRKDFAQGHNPSRIKSLYLHPLKACGSSGHANYRIVSMQFLTYGLCGCRVYGLRLLGFALINY